MTIVMSATRVMDATLISNLGAALTAAPGGISINMLTFLDPSVANCPALV